MASVLHLIIIPPFLAVVCYMFGSILNITREKCIRERIITGFIGVLAVFQVIALPFMYYETNFTPLYIICICFLVLITVVFIYFVVSKRVFIPQKSSIVFWIKRKSKSEVALWALILLLIAFQIFNILYLQHSDYDDSYYLAQTNTVLETNYLMNIEPTTGIEVFDQMVTYKLVGHEVLLAVLAKLFNVNVGFLCHMVLPIFMVSLHYVIVFSLGKEIRHKYKQLFMLLCICVNFFAFFSGASASAFLSDRIWQGKAVLSNIILPILLFEFCKIFKKKEVSYKTILVLALVLWAGFCTTTVGLYLIPIAYFTYTVVFFCVHKNIKNSLKLCIPVLLCIPFVVVKFVSLLSADFFGDSNAFSTTYWASFLTKYLNDNYIIAMFLVVAIIYIWRKGSKLEKMVAVYSPCVLFLTFANPLLFSVISKYVTGQDVYWRIFWLPQFRYIVVIAMLIYIFENIGRKFVSTVVMIFLIAGTGKYIFEQPHYVERENRYKLSDTTIWISDKIIEEKSGEDNYLLIPDNYSFEVRQYTGKVKLVWGRYSQAFYSENDLFSLQQLYNQLYKDKNWNADILEQKLDNFHVNYIFLYNDSLEVNELPNNFKPILEKEDYTLFKVENN